jgi:hypothetical protein
VNKYLAIYLNDHLAGSTLGIELARRLCRSNSDSPYGPPLQRLAEEINEDRETLIGITDRLHIRRDRLKMAGAWAAEKAARLKPNGQLIHYSPLSRLEELEMLSLGVEGKLAMWSALHHAIGPRVADTDLDPLIARANEQRETLEQLRHQAAAEALSGRS